MRRATYGNSIDVAADASVSRTTTTNGGRGYGVRNGRGSSRLSERALEVEKLMFVRRGSVDLVMPSSTADLGGVTHARTIAFSSIEDGGVRRHSIVTQTLITVHNTGNGIASESAPDDAGLSAENGEGRRNFMVEGVLPTWER